MVEYPHVRKELIYYIKLLSDIERTRRVWVEQTEKPEDAPVDNFNFAFAFFFDSISLDSTESVGIVFKDFQELESIKVLKKTLREALNRVIDPMAPNEEFIANKQWFEVVHAAQKACLTFDLI